jgi:hypothetical protein
LGLTHNPVNYGKYAYWNKFSQRRIVRQSRMNGKLSLTQLESTDPENGIPLDRLGSLAVGLLTRR